MSLNTNTKQNSSDTQTDQQKLVALLTEFGVGFEVGEGNSIVCKQGAERVVGYKHFLTDFVFNDDGSFKELGCWED